MINIRNFFSKPESLIKLLVTISEFIVALDIGFKNIGAQDRKSSLDLKPPSSGRNSISREGEQN